MPDADMHPMRIEEIFGLLKTVTGLAKLKVRGHVRVRGVVAIALAFGVPMGAYPRRA